MRKDLPSYFYVSLDSFIFVSRLIEDNVVIYHFRYPQQLHLVLGWVSKMVLARHLNFLLGMEHEANISLLELYELHVRVSCFLVANKKENFNC